VEAARLFEVWKLIKHPNELHWVVLAINILVVLYIAWVRWDEIKVARRTRASLEHRSEASD
jgi:uncharacterized membrane protein (DUF2068 family)